MRLSTVKQVLQNDHILCPKVATAVSDSFRCALVLLGNLATGDTNHVIVKQRGFVSLSRQKGKSNMRNDLYNLLDDVSLAVEEKDELVARQCADERRLVIERHEAEHAIERDDDYRLHLIEPRTWTCIAVRRRWPNMRRLIARLSPGVLRKLIENPPSCALHPPTIATAEQATSDATE
jgi:hypothetical protein